ncbi:phage portal protein [Shewanella sp. SE1]|uniref:phage portal protein n=1 Tax=Shewanella sp. SE1 TaxID=2705014 RepID=UPI00138F6370|nr:phage portal protein [Shewanella sp. SE1]NDO73065.1 phage portal protein [Shewanella sp. SE1]
MYNRQFKSFSMDDLSRMSGTFQTASSGVSINTQSALRNSTFYACVSLISTVLSSMGLELYFDNELSKFGTTHRTLTIKPNARQTMHELLTNYVYQKILWGDFVCEVVKDQDGEILALNPSTSKPNISELSNGQLRYQITGFDNKPRTLNQDQVIHIKNHGESSFRGRSMLEVLRDQLGIALAASDNAAQVYRNMSLPGGFLTSDKTLSEQTYNRLKNQFAERYGNDKKWSIGILEDGFKYEQFQIDLEKTQLTQSREFSIAEICRAFGVPTELISHQSKQTPQDLESVNRLFYQNCLSKWVNEFEQAIKLHLRPRSTFKFNPSSLLSADKKATAEIAKQNFEICAITINEVRQAQGLPPVQGGDVFAIDTNNITLGQLTDISKPSNPKTINTDKEQDQESGDQ